MDENLRTLGVQYSYSKDHTFMFPDILCEKGAHLLITGVSGCGKTTFLHLLAGLIRPDRGEIYIRGTDIAKLQGTKLDVFRGHEIGIVFQTPYFIKSLTAKENLKLAASLNKLSIDEERLNHLFDSLNIVHCCNRKINEMSQGELQRLSIARAIINEPSVILADEPTSSLDDKNCRDGLDLICLQAEKLNAGLIIATHDNRLIPYFSQIIHLEA